MVTIANSINNTIGGSNSGTTNTLTVTNSSNTASSSARILVTVGGSSAADSILNFNVSGTTDFCVAIDNSDSDRLVLSRSATPGTNNSAFFDSTGMQFPSGTGITFNTSSGTTGTSTANQLAQYEEGTWTPTVQTSNGDMSSISYTTQVGRYKILDEWVFLDLSVTWSAGGAGTGNLIVNNLAFTSDAAGQNTQVPILTSGFTWSGSAGGRTQIFGTIIPPTAELLTRCFGDGTGNANNATDATGTWIASATYRK
jgi:hypothetical protein